MTILVACGLQREAAICAREGFVAIAGGGNTARLEAALEAAVAAGGVTAILSSGLAGALDPGLTAGDMVLGDMTPGVGRGPVAWGEENGQGARPAGPSVLDPGLRRETSLLATLARMLPQAHVGAIAGADTIIASAAAKRALYEATGALAVDMESHVAARVADRHDLPFAILRTISDSADHALPPAALVGMNPDGSIALGKVLLSLARAPGQLPALLRTGRDANAAFASLARALRALDLADPAFS